jgi:hypothetical protein
MPAINVQMIHEHKEQCVTPRLQAPATRSCMAALHTFFLELPGGAESYWLATHDSIGRTQLPGA